MKLAQGLLTVAFIIFGANASGNDLPLPLWNRLIEIPLTLNSDGLLIDCDGAAYDDRHRKCGMFVVTPAQYLTMNQAFEKYAKPKLGRSSCAPVGIQPTAHMTIKLFILLRCDE